MINLNKTVGLLDCGAGFRIQLKPISLILKVTQWSVILDDCKSISEQ